MKRRVVLLGPPGSGKGTIATQLQAEFGLKHISSGQWLRREIESGTETGSKAKLFLDRGQLAPDEMVLALVGKWLTADVLASGFILDGYPRTKVQAVELDRYCEPKESRLESVLFCSCSDATLIGRMSGRRVCPDCGRSYHVDNMPPKRSGLCDVCDTPIKQRADDTEAIVRSRLAIYNRETEPLVEFYRSQDKLFVIDANEGTESTLASAREALKS